MKMKRFLALLMAACMLVSTPVMASGTTTTEVVEAVEVNETEEATEEKSTGVVAPEDAAPVEENTEVDSEVSMDELTEVGDYKITEVERESIEVELGKESEAANSFLNEETVKDTDLVDVIIVMDDASIIEKDSDATMNWLTKIQIAILESKQSSIVSKIERKVLDGEDIEIRYQYTWLLNGIATKVPYGAIDEIKAVAGVKDVLLEMVYEACETTLEPYTVADGTMIGRDQTWANGYTGEGIKISIIDTGLDTDHQNFAALPEDKLTADSATEKTVEAVLKQLNANKIQNIVAETDLTIDDVYYSTKVAYGFNYVDGNTTIHHGADNQGDHGTHVAGIAAANDLGNDEAVGVAPDAQLYVMKVFGANGGAYTSDILAALEDSLILGADVVNMSLGSPAGFTSDGETFDEIYGRVDDTNTILAVAAGNSTTAGIGNVWGTDTNLTSNPDNSVVSSPATYMNATSVASVDNVGVKGYYMETVGTQYSYLDGSNGEQDSFLTFGGQSYDYVMVGNAGQTPEDFAAVDVKGKIAVVSRGVTAFSEKHMLAEDAGAIAVLVYNNASGSFGMDLSESAAVIPCASITAADGAFLAAAKAEDANAKIYVSDKQIVVANPTAYQMSDFTSWGISPDLKLEPDVTAPGGNIYSTLDGGNYGVMSGTSMASPNMAGVAALVMQYAKATYPEMTASELHTFVNSVIVSTATPLAYSEGVDYSPRQQGAGLVNAYDAINTTAYLTVDGMEVAKAELGDDVAKTGSYKFNFNVVNFGKETLYYNLETTAQTEGVLNYDPYFFMSTTPVAVPATTDETSENIVLTYDYSGDAVTDTVDARQLYLKALKEEALEVNAYTYDLSGDDALTEADAQSYLDALVGKNDVELSQKTLTVEAGKTVNVSVSVDLAAESKEYMDTYFENGIYVEGFTKLTAKNTGVDLSLPYLAFYGDWTKAPIFDSGYYWELFTGELVASQYYHVLFGEYGPDISKAWYPGLNPYIDEAFDMNNISVSPNGDMYMDSFVDIYLSLLRNADVLSFKYTDAKTGEVYFEEILEHVSKTYYMAAYQQMFPFVYARYSEPYTFVDANGEVLPSGTELVFTISATLDYDAHESNNLSDEWVVPVTVDTKAPELISSKSYKDDATGRYFMELTIKDEVGVAAVNILNKGGTVIFAQEAVEVDDRGKEVTVTYDVTGYGEDLTVILGDYAFNESAYLLEVEGNDPILDETLLYGYRVADTKISNDTKYGWIGIDPATAETTVYSSEYYMDYALVAAANVGGQIVAVDAKYDLVTIDPGYWDERAKITSLENKVTLLAFDPSTQTLYGYAKDICAFVTIDVATGKITNISGEDAYVSSIMAMACTDEGVLYAINSSGKLYVVDKATGTLGEMVCATGLSPYYSQSMTYDKDTNSLYWAYYASRGEARGKLHKIDLTDNAYTVTQVGPIAGNAEVVGLLTLDKKEYTLPETAIESISVDTAKVVLLPGGEETVNVVKNPWYAKAEDYVWSSKDETIAVVENGVITAVSVGTTTIRVETEDGEDFAEVAVEVVDPKGELFGYSLGGDTTMYQWISFGAAKEAELKALTPMPESSFMQFNAGEYVDGYIYAFSATSEMYKIDTNNNFAMTKLSDANSGWSMSDMAYDYKTGYMYGIYTYIDYMMNEYVSQLVRIDTMTGATEVVNGNFFDSYGSAIVSMAINTEGTMYLLAENGILYTYAVDTETFTMIGQTGYTPSSMLQSMAFDHNTNELYWAMIDNTGSTSLMYVDTVTGKALALGDIDGFSQVVAMYSVPKNAPVRPEVPVESLTLTANDVIVLTGSTASIPVSVKPFNATNRNVTWTSADPTIATVENGVIVGKKAGTTTLTGTLGDKSTGALTVNVIESTGALVGYVLADLATYDGYFWAQFMDNNLAGGQGLAMSNGIIYAGEYFDGNIYAYGVDYDTYDYTFYIFDGKTYEQKKAVVLATDTIDVREMAFDYSTGTMFAIAGTKNSNAGTKLYKVDMADGTLYEVGGHDAIVMTLACTEAGALYGIDMDGVLYQINKETAELTKIKATGYGANQYQSMAYDYDTGNMYWAQINSDGMTGSVTANLFIVNVTDGSLINLGTIGMMGCEVTALHSVPEKTVTVQAAESTSILLNSNSEVISTGGSFKLSAYTGAADVNKTTTFTSSDTAVATVAEDGTITAVAAGKATITVARGELTATCEVTVVGDDTLLYVTNTLGWETSPVLKPATIATKVTLPTEAGLVIAEACYNQDGYFYAVDADANLWRYTEDLVEVVKVGNILEQLSDKADYANATKIAIKDLEANPYTGKVYALVTCEKEIPIEKGTLYAENFALYEVNLTTGAATFVNTIGSVEALLDDIIVFGGRAEDFAFISATEIAIYDTMMDYIYTADINTMDEEVKQLTLLQPKLSSGQHLDMAYSTELGRLFIATDDRYYNRGMVLYMLNPVNGVLTKVANAKYDAGLTGIMFIEGTTPVAGVAPTELLVEETEIATEEATEVVEETEVATEEATEVVEESEAITEEATEVVEESEVTTEEATEVVEESEATTEEATEVVEDSETTEITE